MRTEYLKTFREAANHFKKGNELLQGGPLEFYLTEMATAFEEFVARCARFHEGDRVELIEKLDLENSPGWKHCEHFLVPGNPATVEGIAFKNRRFCYDLVFDRETWIDFRGGTERPVERKCRFLVAENHLKRHVDVNAGDK